MTDDKPPRSTSAPLAACGAILAVLALVGLAHGYERSRSPPEPDPVALAPRDAGTADVGTGNVARLLEGQPLDLNRASAEELELLPRIGPTLARRIIEDREQRGPFRSVHDLTRVRGIGPRTLEGLAPLATASFTEP
jgi:competence protein ComEA